MFTFNYFTPLLSVKATLKDGLSFTSVKVVSKAMHVVKSAHSSENSQKNITTND